MLAFCATLAPAEWRMNSLAEGWRIQDVVAHLGTGCHAVFSPAAAKLMRGNDIERTNDAMVDSRRDWSSTDVLAEYRRWSRGFGAVFTTLARTPLGGVQAPLAELGKFPARLLTESSASRAVLLFPTPAAPEITMPDAIGSDSAASTSRISCKRPVQGHVKRICTA
jgi:uncharacterized protein (TIGR03083 family)